MTPLKLRRAAGSPTPSAQARPRRAGLAAIPYLLLIALLVVGTAPVYSAFAGPRGVIAATEGIAIGALAALAAARLRLGPLLTLALAAIAHASLGPLLLHDVGSGMTAVRAVLAGTVTVWKNSLTLPLPLSGYVGMSVLPWLAGLAISTLSCRLLLAGWARTAGLIALALPAILIAWGGRSAPAARLIGPALVILLLLMWAAAARGQRASRLVAGTTGSQQARRLVTLRHVVGAAIILSIGAGIGLALPAAEGERHLLREAFEPPLDLREYATPLGLTRALETDQASARLLSVEGLSDGARIAVATLDSYDGLAARISGGTGSDSGFRPLGAGAALAPTASEPATVRMTMEDYALPWVPTVPTTASIEVGGERSILLRETLYRDGASPTLITTAGLTRGDIVTVRTSPQDVPSLDALTGDTVRPIQLGTVDNVPPGIAAMATRIVGDQSDPVVQIAAMQNALRAGAYSNGTNYASPPGHGAARLASMISREQLIGDDEQYSVLMMLMCRSLGIPARVVMGFRPSTDGDASNVTGEDVYAWVEIPFENHGWVPVDVTPDRDQVPEQLAAHDTINPQPQALQPPLPLPKPEELPPSYDDPDQDHNQPEPVPEPISRLLLLIGGSILAILAPFLLILGLKALRRRRRRRRQGADGALGAWDELLDLARDLRAPLKPGATRHETARSLDARFPSAGLIPVANGVDEAVFGAGEPASDTLNSLWSSADTAASRMRSSLPLPGRLRGRLSPRSLAAPRRAAASNRVRRNRTS
ncbi:transglutaminase-like domain-containing protein [Actinomyces gaoshouyii]|uniref:Cysteine protease n=1 Tax=Actinomyces gaoshouyii TaxID=1960083 RepID=A0A8H9LGL7_9ACTO|nr:transglutaminase-like domain-containing protein [Actinomyces gaoshouyii]GGO99777.1 cysteine protease [Actinomyces gaoshouyii]